MKTTNETPIRLIVGALIVLLVAPAVMAQEVQKNPERFRAELLGYVQDLGRLSPAVVDRIYKNEFSLVEAEQTVQALTSEELRVMEQNLTLVPFWRELPAMLAEKSLSDPAIQMLRQQSSAQPSQIDPETLRQPMLAFVRALRQMPKELVGDEYHQRIDRVERTISEVDAKQLGELNLAFNERMPVWMEATSNRSGRLRPQTDSHCGSAFPASVVCELNHVFDTIAAIPGQVATFATDAVSFISNELKKLFETVQNAIPTTPSGFLALINLSNNPNFQNLLGSIQEIKPPCPTSVPGIGDVGDVRAMYVCQRGP